MVIVQLSQGVFGVFQLAESSFVDYSLPPSDLIFSDIRSVYHKNPVDIDTNSDFSRLVSAYQLPRGGGRDGPTFSLWEVASLGEMRLG